MKEVLFKGKLYSVDEFYSLYIEQNLTLREVFNVLEEDFELSFSEFKSLVNKTGFKKSIGDVKFSQGKKSRDVSEEIEKIIKSSGKVLEDFESRISFARYLNVGFPEFSVRQFEKRLSIFYPSILIYFFDVNPELRKLIFDKTVDLSTVSIKSHRVISWVCSLGHVYDRSFSEMSKISESNYCYFCSNQKVLEGFNDLKSQYPEVALDYSIVNEIPVESIFARSSLIVCWVCFECGVKWEQAVCNRTSYSEAGCPNCSDKISKYESLVVEFISSFYDGLILRNKMPLKDIGGNRLQLDIYLPEVGLAFEIQDFATHSKSSENEVLNYRGLSGFKKGPVYHENKRYLSLSQLGVILVDLWEDEISSGSFCGIVLEAFKNLE